MKSENTTPHAPLIPRHVLFGSPDVDSPRLSPDGAMLLYLAPFDGKQSVWVCTIGQDDDRIVAHDPARPIPWARWQGDGRHVLFLQDRAGDENFHLFQVDALGQDRRDLTPGDARSIPLAVDARFPNDILITSNARDSALMDVHRVDCVLGAITLDTENPRDVMLWLPDSAFVVRAVVAHLPSGSYVIRVRDAATAPWRDLDEISFADGIPHLVTFSADGNTMYAITAKDANTSCLVRYDLETGVRTVVFDNPEYDVERTYVDQVTREVLAVAVLSERLAWTALDSSVASDLIALGALHDGDLVIEDTNAFGTVLIARYRSDMRADEFYLYERPSRRSSLLFSSRPVLDAYELASMHPIAFTARDGLPIHGYLTLPVYVPPERLPMVLFVHGGPWHRDRWGFDPVVQWLANRGYGVLQVNFRGSTGYGKAFRNAGNREWAGAMRTDLLDARDWAIRLGYADPERFAIFGASYGGYAVLTALAWTPGAFACGVDVVGPSDLRTFLASIPPYWEPMRKLLHERVGEDPDFLSSQSPLLRASSIRAPLLIAQGANDPRVKQNESDQIVAALRRSGIPVQYVVFENEGHGLEDPTNFRCFMALAEEFLAQTLGGLFEPREPDEDIAPLLR